jgi:O-antigen/teichoic acid export membrane protein
MVVSRLRQQRVKIQTVATAMTGMTVYALSAITGPLLAGALGPAGRGDLTSVQVPSQLFGYILCFGLPEAAVYFAARHERRQTISASWCFSLVIGGVAVAGLWWVIPVYLHGHAPETVVWLRTMLVAMIVFVPVSVAVNLTRMRASMLTYNLLTAFPYVLNTVLIVVLRVSGHLDLHTALVAFFGTGGPWPSPRSTTEQEWRSGPSPSWWSAGWTSSSWSVWSPRRSSASTPWPQRLPE